MTNKYMEIFCHQAETHLASLRKGLLVLELHPTRSGLLHDLLRSVYALKGSAGMLGLSGISTVTQAMMEHLKRIEQKGRVDDALLRSLLEGVETVAVMTSALAGGTAAELRAEHQLTR